jgi:hypothetical protein
MINSLNRDQLKALAKLCFDLAKAAFVLAMLAPLGQTFSVAVTSNLRSYFVGLAFTYFGLILLKTKESTA